MMAASWEESEEERETTSICMARTAPKGGQRGPQSAMTDERKGAIFCCLFWVFDDFLVVRTMMVVPLPRTAPAESCVEVRASPAVGVRKTASQTPRLDTPNRRT